MGTPGSHLLPGDDGYADQLFLDFRNGYVTEGEWEQLSWIHEKPKPDPIASP